MTQNFCRLLAAAILMCACASIATRAQAKPEEKTASAAERSKAMKEIDFTWKRAKKWTLDYIDAMPEDALNFKPTPEIRSFGEQMLHLAYWNCGLSEWKPAEVLPVRTTVRFADKEQRSCARHRAQCHFPFCSAVGGTAAGSFCTARM